MMRKSLKALALWAACSLAASFAMHSPVAAEQGRATEFLARYERSLAGEGVPADRRTGEAWAALARALLASNEFLYVD